MSTRPSSNQSLMIWRPQSFAAKARRDAERSTLAVTARAARSERRDWGQGQGAVPCVPGSRGAVSRTEVMPTFGDCKRCRLAAGPAPPAMVASPPMLPARLCGDGDGPRRARGAAGGGDLLRRRLRERLRLVAWIRLRRRARRLARRGALGRADLPRLDRWAVALLATSGGFVAWQGLSVLWSIAPDRSWDTFDKGVVLVAFLGLGLLAGRGAARVQAGGAAAGRPARRCARLGAPRQGDSRPLPGRRARRPGCGTRSATGTGSRCSPTWRCRSPSGSARAAARADGRGRGAARLRRDGDDPARGLARTGVAGRGRRGRALARARPIGASRPRCSGSRARCPAAALAGWAFTRPALVDDGQAHADRVRDGARSSAVLALVGAALVAAACRWASRRELGAGDAASGAALVDRRGRVRRGRRRGAGRRRRQPGLVGAGTVRERDGDRSPSRAADEPRLEQPLAVVEGGGDVWQRRPGERHRRRHVRARPAALPRERAAA